MSTFTTLQLLNYYSSLLIKQYASKPKAIATVQALVNGVLLCQTSTQQISFSIPPTAGTFTLSYNANSTTSLGYAVTDSEIQTALQTLPGLNNVTVLDLLVTFTGVIPPALLLTATSDLMASGKAVAITITETDVTLPIAIQNAYNILPGSIQAVGIQLDVLGKYVGVTRSGVSTTGVPITLDDSDFILLIQMAIIKNNSGSSLSDIVGLLYQFFGTEILLFDQADMRMTYVISSLISSNLLQLFITQGILPAPMGVNVDVIIYAPIINAFFGFITYGNPVQSPITRPFNDYADYQTTWPWFSYQDSITS
jgi:hypothetical protein